MLQTQFGVLPGDDPLGKHGNFREWTDLIEMLPLVPHAEIGYPVRILGASATTRRSQIADGCSSQIAIVHVPFVIWSILINCDYNSLATQRPSFFKCPPCLVEIL